jgi:electron transfer flavoprotein beta subunit
MNLNIIICIKSVIIKAPEGRVIRTMDNCVLNPYDRPALEIAMRLREENGGSVTAVSMGPETGAQALYEALAMGVDRAVLISDRAFAGADTLATSKTLSAVINKLKTFDLLIFGARTSDSDTGQVGPQTAVRLDLPIVTGVCEVNYQDSKIVAERRIDEFIEKYEMSLPGAIAIHPGAVQPRDPALIMIEKAFKKGTFEKMNLSDLGLAEEEVGERGSPTKVVSMNKIKRKRKCEFITGSIEEQAAELVRRLKDAGHVG